MGRKNRRPKPKQIRTMKMADRLAFLQPVTDKSISKEAANKYNDQGRS